MLDTCSWNPSDGWVNVDLETLQKHFPAVCVTEQLALMEKWLRKEDRKPPRSWEGFIRRWLQRAGSASSSSFQNGFSKNGQSKPVHDKFLAAREKFERWKTRPDSVREAQYVAVWSKMPPHLQHQMNDHIEAGWTYESVLGQHGLAGYLMQAALPE